MKTHVIPILLLAACCVGLSAQAQQYVTLTIPPNGTNSYTVVQGQAAETVNESTWEGAFSPSISMQKDGYTFQEFTGIVQGPATIQVSSPNGLPFFVTLQILPESYNPNKTLIIPPGTNQVQITLQVSPDLVNWSTTTNGIYGSPNTAQFFRICEQNLGSP